MRFSLLTSVCHRGDGNGGDGVVGGDGGEHGDGVGGYDGEVKYQNNNCFPLLKN